MICKGCGKELPDKAKFCPFCGYRMVNALQDVPPAIPKKESETQIVGREEIDWSKETIFSDHSEEEVMEEEGEDEEEENAKAIKKTLAGLGIIIILFMIIVIPIIIIDEKNQDNLNFSETTTSPITYSEKSTETKVAETKAMESNAHETSTLEMETYLSEDEIFEKYKGSWTCNGVDVTIYEDETGRYVDCIWVPRANLSVLLAFESSVIINADGSISADYDDDGWGNSGNLYAMYDETLEQMYLNITAKVDGGMGWKLETEGYSDKKYPVNYQELIEIGNSIYDSGKVWTSYDDYNGKKYAVYIKDTQLYIEAFENEQLVFFGSYRIITENGAIYAEINDNMEDCGKVYLSIYGFPDKLKLNTEWVVSSFNISGQAYYDTIYNSCFRRMYSLEERTENLSVNLGLMEQYEGEWLINGTNIEIYEYLEEWRMSCTNITADGGRILFFDIPVIQDYDRSITGYYYDDGQGNYGSIYANYNQETGGMHVQITVDGNNGYGNGSLQCDGYALKKYEITGQEIHDICTNVYYEDSQTWMRLDSYKLYYIDIVGGWLYSYVIQDGQIIHSNAYELYADEDGIYFSIYDSNMGYFGDVCLTMYGDNENLCIYTELVVPDTNMQGQSYWQTIYYDCFDHAMYNWVVQ